MSPADREQTLRRLEVIREWNEAPGRDAGGGARRRSSACRSTRVDQFYRLAKRWRASGSIVDLGVARKVPARRNRLDGDVVNELQKAVVRIVAEGKDAYVSELVRRLARTDIGDKRMLSESTLRKIVEREVHRVTNRQAAGSFVRLDVAAVAIARMDSSLHVMFGIVDAGTRLILGFALGELGASAEGYRAAALDGLTRIDLPGMRCVPWADETSRVDVVIGEDEAACLAMVQGYRGDGRHAHLAATDGRRRYGRYFREFVGDRIGRTRLLSASVSSFPPPSTSLAGPFDVETATAWLEIEVADYNAGLIETIGSTDESTPSAETRRVLRYLAGLPTED